MGGYINLNEDVGGKKRTQNILFAARMRNTLSDQRTIGLVILSLQIFYGERLFMRMCIDDAPFARLGGVLIDTRHKPRLK
jgi:hypothetical protein